MVTTTRFQNKEYFYSKLSEIYSEMDVDFELKNISPKNILTDINQRINHRPIYLRTTATNTGSFEYTEAIFRYKDSFYVYLAKHIDESKYYVKIIHKTEDLESVKMYINGLKKIKNGS